MRQSEGARSFEVKDSLEHTGREEGRKEPFERKRNGGLVCTHFNEEIDCCVGQIDFERTSGAREGSPGRTVAFRTPPRQALSLLPRHLCPKEGMVGLAAGRHRVRPDAGSSWHYRFRR